MGWWARFRRRIIMQQLLKTLDYLWNIRFIKGFRSLLARSFLIGVSVYQFIATAKPVISTGIDLPDIPLEVYAALVAYFGLKLEQFAKEHTT